MLRLACAQCVEQAQGAACGAQLGRRAAFGRDPFGEPEMDPRQGLAAWPSEFRAKSLGFFR